MNKWISIDKEKPACGQKVLACFNDGFLLIGSYMNYAEDEDAEDEPFWVFDGEDDYNIEDCCVVAWMPLPKPYKEQQDEA